MQLRISNQAGFGHIAALFVVLFIAVAGFAGYKVVSMNKTAESSASSVVVSPKVPEKITTKADLTATSKALDGSNASVSSGLNDGSLDADLNDML